MRRRQFALGLTAGAAGMGKALAQSNQYVPFVPTGDSVVDAMLKLADVDRDDLVYDLGSGDGRIVIQAARAYGARGVGIDIDPELVEQSRKHAAEAGVSDRVTFYNQDLFVTDLRPATVVTLYLFPEVNRRLRPKLFEQLRPGTAVVSNEWDMGEWQADRTLKVAASDRPYQLYSWVIPVEVAGTWRWQTGREPMLLKLDQRFQQVSGSLIAPGGTRASDCRLHSEQLEFALMGIGRFQGRVRAGTIEGTLTRTGGAVEPWRAERTAAGTTPWYF